MNKLASWSADNLSYIALAALTLGLAPFAPEPHVWEKIKWVYNGAEGMAWYDLLDLLLHGSPWVLLPFGIIGKSIEKRKSKRSNKSA